MVGGTTFEIFALWSVLGTAILGLAYAVLLTIQVLREEKGTPQMLKISNAILIGANAYLRQQFKTVVWLIILLTIGLYLTARNEQGQFDQHLAVGRAMAFLAGAIFSATVGYVGMNMACRGNVRVAAASRRSFSDALRIAYRTGTITGMLTDGLGLLGGTTIFMIYGQKAYEVLLGFGFGGCLLALFMRVGGGIYTKAADVGADLVGKLEKGIPEDDPRNAATIADNVGDNVGDCAGMAADIFESYEVTIVSAMILGYAAFSTFGPQWAIMGVLFPLLVRAIGVFSSIIGTYAVRARGEKENAMRAISRGFIISALISIVGFCLVGYFYLRPDINHDGTRELDMRPVWATLVGIVLAVIINRLTEYFTSTEHKPVKEVASSTQTGHATTILSGLALGYESTVWAILVIAASVFASVLIYHGQSPVFVAYGVAMCGIGMLTLTGNNISMDVFGPVVDNANGIGEMAHMEPKARQIMADLDAVGNTTKAITKGIAIGSAVIAAVSLFNAYITDISKLTGQKYAEIAGRLSLSEPSVLIGLLIGGAMPFLFSSFMIRAVGRAAHLIVKEVRYQFANTIGLMEGKADPDYGKVVSICTTAAQKELIGPGLLAILAPIIVGMLLHKEALGGFLAGIIVSGQLLAVFMANAGGAWDNAKKSIEDGLYGGKGSESHKASITGDTVGDPLKDTAGPALNPLIKVMNLVAILVVPLVVASENSSSLLPFLIAGVAIIVVGASIWYSKKESFGGVEIGK
jgi:K(+)-stimulated pyrophosphate-energized sodium pump